MYRRVYITVGLPGAGKSSWARRRVESDSNLFIVCGDAFRSMLMGVYFFDPDRGERLVRRLFLVSVREVLQERAGVILDECILTLTRKQRREWCEFAWEWGSFGSIKTPERPEIFLVYFPEGVRDLVGNRLKDARGLPVGQWVSEIERLRGELEVPSQDELEELANDFGMHYIEIR